MREWYGVSRNVSLTALDLVHSRLTTQGPVIAGDTQCLYNYLNAILCLCPFVHIDQQVYLTRHVLGGHVTDDHQEFDTCKNVMGSS